MYSIAALTLFTACQILGQDTPQKNETQRYETAAKYYEDLLARSAGTNTSPSNLIKIRTDLGTVYFMLHRYADSLRALQPLNSTSNVDTAKNRGVPAQVWTITGLDHLELNQLPEAINSLRYAISVDPNAGTARLALGDALARSNRLSDAEQEYEEQTRRTPSLPDAWYKLGLVHAKLASELPQGFGPDFRNSLIGQQIAAEEQLAGGNNLDAARSLFRLIHQAPRDPEIHADLGSALLELGYSKFAEDQFREELSLNPKSPVAALGLAQTDALKGQWTEAVSYIEQVSREHPHELRRRVDFPPAGPLRQAWTEGRIRIPEQLAASAPGQLWKAWLGDSGSAATLVNGKPTLSDSCTKAPPASSMEPGMWLVDACYQRLVEELRAEKRITIQARIKLTEAEFRLGKHTAALADAESLLASSPGEGWGVYWLNKAHAALAEDCFLKVGSLNPNSPRVHQMLAQHYLGWSDYPKAKAEYLIAIQLAPELPDLHLGLGSVYWRAGEWPQAEKELQKTLELAPASAIAHYELGDVYLHERQWQLAMAQLRRVANDPAVALDTRIDLAKAEDETGQARQALEDLLPVQVQDKDGEIHFLLAGLYRELGDTVHRKEAVATFKRLRATSLEANQNEFDALEKEHEHVESSGTPGAH